MISRLTAFAATFAVLVTATLAVAASAPSHDASAAKPAATQPMKVVQLERVVVTGKRVADASR